MIIRLPIDVKSLFYNIKNDNETGHTATVSTPIRQYGSVDEELAEVFWIPENVKSETREGIVGRIMVKSRSEARIVKVCVFNKITVNGQELEGSPSFCFYVREETAEGYIHCGRQKLHYPVTLRFSGDETEIDNRSVISLISDKLHGYAFIIEAFEYDTCKGSLNFDATIIGYNDIPYSKVFINKRGAGGKFTAAFSEEAESYDSEIIALRQKLGYGNVNPENFNAVMKSNKEKADDLVKKYLFGKGVENVRHLADEHPYALYDFEYVLNGIKRYAIVRFTSTKTQYFNLPVNKIKFCADFSEETSVILVCDINGIPEIYEYGIYEMNRMSKTINSVCYEVTGGEI